MHYILKIVGLSLLLVACQKKEGFEGTWLLETGDEVYRYTFYEDNTYVFTYNYDGVLIESSEGTYLAEGNFATTTNRETGEVLHTIKSGNNLAWAGKGVFVHTKTGGALAEGEWVGGYEEGPIVTFDVNGQKGIARTFGMGYDEEWAYWYEGSLIRGVIGGREWYLVFDGDRFVSDPGVYVKQTEYSTNNKRKE